MSSGRPSSGPALCCWNRSVQIRQASCLLFLLCARHIRLGPSVDMTRYVYCSLGIANHWIGRSMGKRPIWFDYCTQDGIMTERGVGRYPLSALAMLFFFLCFSAFAFSFSFVGRHAWKVVFSAWHIEVITVGMGCDSRNTLFSLFRLFFPPCTVLLSFFLFWLLSCYSNRNLIEPKFFLVQVRRFTVDRERAWR